MRELSISLPETVTINGAKDAPEEYRVLRTEKWDEEFILTALVHGVSQALGDTWSVSKKDAVKLAAKHEALEAGEWNRRTQGIGAAKFDAAIAALDFEELVKKLTPQQLAAMAAMGKSK